MIVDFMQGSQTVKFQPIELFIRIQTKREFQELYQTAAIHSSLESLHSFLRAVGEQRGLLK